EIAKFKEANPGAVTGLIDDTEAADAQEKPKPEKRRKKEKQPKQPFFLNPGDGDNFVYKDLYVVAEIKDELNRITTAENVKHIFGTDIFRVLTQMGYVEEKSVNGRTYQTQTALGLSKGITSVEKEAKSGTVYTILMYPPEIQKEIVEYYGTVPRSMKGVDNLYE
ncbi:MAG: hypothetical protein J6D53_02010, partial [Blautia sp.]|nr:hypothetical protein [Blautia sp.]